MARLLAFLALGLVASAQGDPLVGQVAGLLRGGARLVYLALPHPPKDPGAVQALVEAHERGSRIYILLEEGRALEPKGYSGYLMLRGIPIRLARVTTGEALVDGRYLGPVGWGESFPRRFREAWKRARPLTANHFAKGSTPLVEDPFAFGARLIQESMRRDAELMREAEATKRVLERVQKERR